MNPEHDERSLKPDFVFDYVPLDDLGDVDPLEAADEQTAAPDPSRRWSTWLSVEPLCRGPEPRPAWVVQSQAAIDTDLGILKSGKEADAFLLERAIPDSDRIGEAVVMVAKRYRGAEHRSFHRAASYTEGRTVRNSRDRRAINKKSTFGKAVAAGQWANAEWTALKRLWQLGLAVPYPVQIDGTELLMEWITGPDGDTAPRLAQTRPEADLLADYFEQLRDFLFAMVGDGLVHGDLSAYNILAAGERLVVIDLPQLVDLVANPTGLDFLMRDCVNVCGWFNARGLGVDAEGLFAELAAYAF
jgi:RIO kinase 1